MAGLAVRDLHYNFPIVERWLADRREIAITKRRRQVAALSPPRSSKPKKFDVEAHVKWLKETWGDRVFVAEEVREMPEFELGDRS
jgi:hypothetical protein